MGDPVREAREELRRVGLRASVQDGGVVPDLVLRSWRRSIGSSVDGVSPVARWHEVDADTILCRAAEPVLDRWQHQLADTGTTLFLGDRAGSIVARRTSDSSVKRRLDRVHAAEGFDYSEESVGTNGIGTSMVEGRAVLIEGSQHFHDALSRLACAAAPVCAPSGLVLGSVSLGSPLESANPLMLSLTREIGQQIEERLRTDARPQDLALAMSFMRFTNSKRPTVVMDSESILANTPGLPYVNVESHVLLWQMLNDHDWVRSRTARLALEGSGVEVMARRVLDGPRSHFVLHFAQTALAEVPGPDRVGGVGEAGTARPRPRALVAVAGPRGSGRATAAQALQQERSPLRGLEVLPVTASGALPASRAAELTCAGTDVLLRRLDLVGADQAGRLRELLADQVDAVARGEQRGTLLVTSTEAFLAELGVDADLVVRTEALRATPERIPGLVKSALDRADPRGRRTISPAALQALVQHTWPGNVSELVETVEQVVRDAAGSVVELRDLPAGLRQPPPRRPLSLIESAQRDAIIKALAASGGNKSEAATLLGMGRTTLYRQLRQLGLDGDETSL